MATKELLAVTINNSGITNWINGGVEMKRRNENIRKSCDEINKIADFIMSDDFKGRMTIGVILKIIAHRIKRTTWRGDTKTKWVMPKGEKTITTSGIDVSTIPYY